MQCIFEPYEGNKPYIFVSYSHRDGDRVAPILNRMHREGFRIWYDEGIDWGTEWPAEIEKHLLGSTVCLAFHSKSSVDSVNCRQEITFAIQHKKGILPIYLEEVTLKDGLEMQMTLYQAIHHWQYKDQEKFFNRLLRAQMIQCCREGNEHIPLKKTADAGTPELSSAGDHPELPWIPEGNHTYYCPCCGEELNRKKVLYDLGTMLELQLGVRLEILKLRLLEQELLLLRQKDPDARSREFRVALSLEEILGYMSNERNLNSPAIRTLTQESFQEFLRVGQEAPEDPRWAEWMSAVIQASGFPKKYGPEMLSKEMRALAALMGEDNRIHLSVEVAMEEDDQGDQVIVGLDVYGPRGHCRCKRVCDHCGMPVYDHAGTAEHKSVVFLGKPGSGKRSIILALTHYAMNHMQYDTGNPIWQGANQIHAVSELELVDHYGPFLEGLKNYERGIAPGMVRWNWGGSVYTATFRIRGKRIDGKQTNQFLTLIEFPGELVDTQGSLKASTAVRKFPILKSCRSLVLCVDGEACDPAKAANRGQAQWSPLGSVQEVTKWMDQFQSMMVALGRPGPVPTMVLFTKAPELEAEDWQEPTHSVYAGIESGLYLLTKEQTALSQNKLYRFLLQQFTENGSLGEGFYAAMRCSAFGFTAHNAGELYRLPESEQTVHTPRPVRMDKLMWWILMVTGCIPVSNRKSGLWSESYLLSRAQYRRENPRIEGGDSGEAKARCVLFANPGVHDRDLARTWAAWQRWIRKLTMAPDSNGND